MEPKVYPASSHHIREELINPDALFVLKTLHDADFEAYLVGGGVRDLLMGKEPKDFDISTSARPEQVKDLFGRRCLLIGRRFRLAHVRFGKHIVEVATFRAGEQDGEELVTRDNVWGTPEEDVLRRDFTINGLCYDPADHSIIDYAGGFEDLSQHLLRVIGKPATRFRQDPVRMLRALKFQARFGFEAEASLMDAIHECREEILKCAPARILEEILRMMESGASTPFFDLMHKEGFLKLLMPCVDEILTSPVADQTRAYLDAADEWMRSAPPQPPDRAVLCCSLIYPLLERAIQMVYLDQGGPPSLTLIHQLCTDLVDDVFGDSFPRFTRRICYSMVFILEAQYRMTPVSNRKIRNQKMVAHPDFPMAVQFLRIRALVNPDLRKTYEEWRDQVPAQRAGEKKRRPRRRRRR